LTQNSSRTGESDVWIGTSGFVYPHWRNGVFYPPGLPQKEELEFFARSFRTVELNNPFYRLPERETFAGWRRRTPPDFRFAVKASRYITHIRKLKEAREPLRTFLDRARGLGAKLGPVLFQFPSAWGVDLERLRRFLKLLPKRREFAFEFRHPSWLAQPVYDLLHEYKAALCLAVRQTMSPEQEIVTADFTYIRMHSGTGCDGDFTGAELGKWAARIRRFLQAGIRVYIYFNNDQHGFAVRNALDLMSLLGVGR
jgi:uncharacterized protein YecE (DUF72 family)